MDVRTTSFAGTVYGRSLDHIPRSIPIIMLDPFSYRQVDILIFATTLKKLAPQWTELEELDLCGDRSGEDFIAAWVLSTNLKCVPIYQTTILLGYILFIGSLDLFSERVHLAKTSRYVIIYANIGSFHTSYPISRHTHRGCRNWVSRQRSTARRPTEPKEPKGAAWAIALQL